MEKEQKRYTKDEYIAALSEYIGQEKIEAMDALPDYSSARLEALCPIAGKFGTLRFYDGYIYRYHVAADGLLWSVQSMRIASAASQQLRELKVADLLELIWQISEKCNVIGDVPAFASQKCLNWRKEHSEHER